MAKQANNCLFGSTADYRKVQHLAHRLKKGEPESIMQAAARMADMVRQLGEGHRCVLVPIPGHEGKATYTRQLCDAISARTAMPAMDLLQGNRHIALYHAKRNDMKPEGIRITFALRHALPPGATAILVDNVLDTGYTAYAAWQAIGRSDTRLAVLGHTSHYTLNSKITYSPINVEHMVKKVQSEVKQVNAAQGKSRTATGKKTATTETKENQQATAAKTPTMVDQYATLKEKHPDSILLFRTGDFYTALNVDASKVGSTLGVTVTKPRNPDDGTLTAMFPHHALDSYLPKLIRAGMRVAIVDPLDKPQQKSQTAEKPTEAAKEEKAKGEGESRKEPRAPQMVTVNGQKVTHGHAFQSTKNPDTWYFTARLDGTQLRPMVMKPADVDAYQKKETTIENLMGTYYPSKLAPKVSPEQYKADMNLSDGRHIDRMNVYKEKDESREDFGKYKLYAQVDGKGMSTVMKTEDLNAFFDRVTTPARLVEKNFGERLNLASAYEKYRLPADAQVSDIRVAKDSDGEWKVSAKVGDQGRTEKKTVNKTDRYSFFETKTVTREQLAAKYLSADIRQVMAQSQQQKAGLKL